MEENNKKVLLSLQNVDVKFNVRGRTLSAIRNVSLDIYENESIAIVGESGSGKSVLTKTFAGMLDSNGYISHGNIIFSDDEISKTMVKMNKANHRFLKYILKVLNSYSFYAYAGKEFTEKESYYKLLKEKCSLSHQEKNDYENKLKELNDDINDLRNEILTLNSKSKEDSIKIKDKKNRLKNVICEKNNLVKKNKNDILKKKQNFKVSDEYSTLKIAIKNKQTEIKAIVKQHKLEKKLDEQIIQRNDLISKEILLSVGRYPLFQKYHYTFKILNAIKQALKSNIDLTNKNVLNKLFEVAVFRVEYKETLQNGDLLGYAIIDCAKIKYTKDWQQIRGCRIATVFQDPMTSLNPIVTIGKQIMTVILKHQKCSYSEAKERALNIMEKVGIDNPLKRFNDYPFQYSGGMRQRIVIAIALSCQPKILICDEPTTALDVTIQAQIIRLIKDLQKELGFTTVYITHDLGVVANVAERVAVLYGGQIVELGNVEDIFYDPRHPYTWALLSSLPQLCEKGENLFSIPGTPPSLYNKIVGDAFAPRNKYAMAIDLVKEPPMFKISETHFAKTWLLDPRAPKTSKPENIQNLHEKMANAFKNLN